MAGKQIETKSLQYRQENCYLSNWPTATTSGLKHCTTYHARKGESARNTCGGKGRGGGTSPLHNIATSAIGRKRPQQITRTSHVGDGRVHFLSRPERESTLTVFLFLFLFYSWHLSAKTSHQRPADFQRLRHTDDTVNNLHYKAHSWKICPTKEPQYPFS